MYIIMYIHYYLLLHYNNENFVTLLGPSEGRPNNLPQPAWRLAELFFWSDLSLSRADLCANSYGNSTRFSLFGHADIVPPVYIQHRNINRTQFFLRLSLSNNLLAEIYFSFLLMKNRAILERIESVRNSYFWTARFWREILLRNWTIAILERIESDEFFWLAYYLVKTLGPARFRKEWSLTKIFGKLTISFT